MDIKELQEMNIHELVEVARGMNIEALSTLRKSELIFKILEGQTEKNGLIYAEGVLQVLAEGPALAVRQPETLLQGMDDGLVLLAALDPAQHHRAVVGVLGERAGAQRDGRSHCRSSGSAAQTTPRSLFRKRRSGLE